MSIKARWGDLDPPAIGTFWRHKEEDRIFEVVGHDVHSCFGVLLRVWEGTRHEALDRFQEGAKFHHYDEVTEDVHAFYEDAASPAEIEA